MQKPIVVHVHLFKNAGTSVEAALRDHFAERWVSYDKPVPGSRVSQDELLELLEERPHIEAVSSHQIRPPLQSTHRFKFLPVVFLRDPLDRIRSAYDFEQSQGDLTPSSRVASSAPLADWLSFHQNRGSVQVENFQTYALSSIRSASNGAPLRKVPISEHFADAVKFLNQIPAVGLVEHFDTSWALITNWLRNYFPEFSSRAIRSNVTSTEAHLPQRIARLADALGASRFEELVSANEYDRLLYDTIAARLHWAHQSTDNQALH